MEGLPFPKEEFDFVYVIFMFWLFQANLKLLVTSNALPLVYLKIRLVFRVSLLPVPS